MKKILLVVVLFFSLSLITEGKVNYRVGVTFGYFYSSLGSYGDWYEISNGVYVWKPYGVAINWQPYSVGRWLWTSDGWYWDSYEPFGYITYHYGRWFYDDYYGWVWYPSYEWAPAWVEWRYDDYYIGWAPLPPYAIFRYNVGIVFTISWNAPLNYWYFVKYRHFYNDNVWGYGISNNYKTRIYRNTKVRNNYVNVDDRIINNGLNKEYVENRTGYRFAQRNIVNTDNLNDIRANDREVKRYIPKETELRQNQEIKRDNIKNSIGKTSLRLDKVVDENYTIDRNVERNSEKPNRINEERKDNTVIKREDNVKREVESKTDFGSSREQINIERNKENKQVERSRNENTTRTENNYRINDNNRSEREPTREKTRDVGIRNENRTNVNTERENRGNVERKTR